MRRNPYYMLYQIAGVPYLLPFGQNIADHKRGIRINDTGVFLWKALETEHTEAELVHLCADYFETAPEQLPQMTDDIHHFLQLLSAHGILEASASQPIREEPCHFLKIGGLLIQIDAPDEGMSPSFDAFRVTPEQAVSQQIQIHCFPPVQHRNGIVLLRKEELIVMEEAENYIFLFPSQPQIIEAILSKDAALAVFYCLPPFTDALREALFHAIRLPFLYLAQKNHMAVLHSASLLYKGRAWLFSGSSGTGKSTHTGLWHTLLNTPLINGDLNLLALEDGKPVVHGLPWCGTSEIWDTHSYPLGGIILLKQSPTDWVEELPADKKLLLVSQRLISPTWTGELQGRNLEFTGELLQRVPVCRLHCTKEPTAVEIIQKWIDRQLNG